MTGGEPVDSANGDLACVPETRSLIGFEKLTFSCGFSPTRRDTIMQPVSAGLASLDWGLPRWWVFREIARGAPPLPSIAF